MHSQVLIRLAIVGECETSSYKLLAKLYVEQNHFQGIRDVMRYFNFWDGEPYGRY